LQARLALALAAFDQGVWLRRILQPLEASQPLQIAISQMLYLSHQLETQSPETRRALNAADGYLFFGMFNEALEELKGIVVSEQGDAGVLLARIRLLLHKKQWRSAEQLSQHGADLHPDEGEFTVQRAFALHQMRKGDKAAEVLMSAPDWIRRTGILHYNLACYEARLGDLSIARKCIDAAIQINEGIKKSARLDPDLQALWN
jgi:tetratricopeptide (TPR) repeat protein